jgi:uncharacterized spore protein YtfJ
MIDVQTEVDSALETTAEVMNKLISVAKAESVFCTPIEHGNTIIIPCCEVATGGGMGIGGGPGQTEKEKKQSTGWGVGTGGGSNARPIALIVLSPEGVEVKPIVDTTKVVLAALTTVTLTTLWLTRSSRRRQKKSAVTHQLTKNPSFYQTLKQRVGQYRIAR